MWDQFATTLDSMKSFWWEVSGAFPALFAATVLLLIGWGVARLLRRGVIRLLRLLRIDLLAEKAGIEDFLLQGGVRYTTVTLLGNLVYWLIMFTVILAALNSLGLQNASALFNKIILYMPNVIVAILVLMFGALFAKIVRAVTFTYLSNIGISGADVIGHIAQWAILLFVVSVALEQLSLGGQILVSAFQIGFGAICLALAIAFGLGGKDLAAHLLGKIWKQ
jgi:Mechanosensitive ion channel, conserved TM helix